MTSSSFAEGVEWHFASYSEFEHHLRSGLKINKEESSIKEQDGHVLHVRVMHLYSHFSQRTRFELEDGTMPPLLRNSAPQPNAALSVYHVKVQSVNY